MKRTKLKENAIQGANYVKMVWIKKRREMKLNMGLIEFEQNLYDYYSDYYCLLSKSKCSTKSNRLF